MKNLYIEENLDYSLETKTIYCNQLLDKNSNGFFIARYDHRELGFAYDFGFYLPGELAKKAREDSLFCQIMESFIVLDAIWSFASDFKSENLIIDIHFPFEERSNIVFMAQSVVELSRYTVPWLPKNLVINLHFNSSTKSHEIKEVKIDENSYCIGKNGGKDSSLSNYIMKSLGFDDFSYDILKESSSRFGYDMDRVGLISHSVSYTEETNKDNCIEYWSKCSEYQYSRLKPMHMDKQGVLVSLYILPALLYYLEKGKFPKYMVLGSEWGCSTKWKTDKGNLIFDHAFDEGQFVQMLWSRIKKDFNVHTELDIISPIAGLTEISVIKCLIKLGWTWKTFRSCWSVETLYKDNSYEECEACMKCFRIKNILLYLSKKLNLPYIIEGMCTHTVPELSPTAFTYSIGSNGVYNSLMGKDNLKIDELFISNDIKEFMGKDSDKIISLLKKEFNLEEIMEPETPLNHQYIPLKNLVESIMNELGYSLEDNPWINAKNTRKDLSSEYYLLDFTLPFEDFVCEYFNCHPLYSYYTVLPFFDKGNVIYIELTYGDERDIEFKGEAPIINNPIIKRSLKWAEDKVRSLDSHKHHTIKDWRVV